MEVKNEECLKVMYIDYLCRLINQSKYHKVRVFRNPNHINITYYGRKWYQRKKVNRFRLKDLDEMIELIRKICIEIYKEIVPVSWVEDYVRTYAKWIEDNFTNEIRMY